MNSPLLGLDIGFKRTGVAISESGLISRPVGVLQADPPHMTKVLHGVLEYVKEYDIKTLVIGLPYTEDGEPTSQALKVEQVIEALRNLLTDSKLEVEIVTVNEFYSSLEADEVFPGVERDAAAAAIILQHHLDSLAP